MQGPNGITGKWADNWGLAFGGTCQIGDGCSLDTAFINDSTMGDGNVLHDGGYVTDSVVGSHNEFFGASIIGSAVGDDNHNDSGGLLNLDTCVVGSGNTFAAQCLIRDGAIVGNGNRFGTEFSAVFSDSRPTIIGSGCTFGDNVGMSGSTVGDGWVIDGGASSSSFWAGGTTFLSADLLGASLLINGGASVVFERDVTLALNPGSVAATEMAIRNDEDAYGAWEAFAATKAWTLSAACKVWAKFRDGA